MMTTTNANASSSSNSGGYSLKMFMAGMLTGLVIFECINNVVMNPELRFYVEVVRQAETASSSRNMMKRKLSSSIGNATASNSDASYNDLHSIDEVKPKSPSFSGESSTVVGMTIPDTKNDNHGMDDEPTPLKFNWKAYYDDNPKLTIVKMGGKLHSGAGSQICNLIAYKIYVNDMGRNFAVDTTAYYMQYNDNIGLLGGWFNPTFPLVQNKQDQQQLAHLSWQYEDAFPNSTVPGAVEKTKARMREARAKGDHAEAGRLLQKASQMSPPKFNYYGHVDKNEDGIFVMPNPAFTFRDQKFFKKYGNKGNALYQRFAAEACANFQFNKHALRQFNKVKSDRGIPDFRSLVNSSSVAFHVRRGDKLTAGESSFYKGRKYVQTLLNALDKNTHAATTEGSRPSRPIIKHCFVATDDFAAVGEIRDALQKNGIDCTLHSLTMESQTGHITDGNNQYDEIVQFLTEVSMLVDATYFVGTFDSNVGSLVSLLRSCVHTWAPHYHHSYGVDRDHWVFI